MVNRVYIDKVVSIGAVDVGDDPEARILFAKEKELSPEDLAAMTPETLWDLIVELIEPSRKKGRSTAHALNHLYRNPNGIGRAVVDAWLKATVRAVEGRPATKRITPSATQKTKEKTQMTTRTKELVRDRIEKAVDRHAVTMQLEPGNFGRPIYEIRNTIRRSEIGKKLVEAERSPEGARPFVTIYKTKVDPDVRAYIEKWGV